MMRVAFAILCAFIAFVCMATSTAMYYTFEELIMRQFPEWHLLFMLLPLVFVFLIACFYAMFEHLDEVGGRNARERK